MAPNGPSTTVPRPIHDATGTIVGTVLVFRDVSDRLQAYETHSRLAAIVESSQE